MPLSAVAHYRYTVQPQTVNHQGVSPAVTLSFNLAPGVSFGQAVDAMQAAQHVPAALHGEFQGTARAFQPCRLHAAAAAAATLVVYIAPGMLYESFIHPITILSALPSAGVGALLMLMLFGYDLSLVVLIGIILLIGIVKKDPIMMIDFALAAERHEGKSPLAAIHEACLLRFWPIMTTTMSTVWRTAACGRSWRRLAAAPSTRHRHRWWPARLAGADALHHAVIYLVLDRLLHWLAPRRHHASIGVAEHTRASADGAVNEL